MPRVTGFYRHWLKGKERGQPRGFRGGVGGDSGEGQGKERHRPASDEPDAARCFNHALAKNEQHQHRGNAKLVCGGRVSLICRET